MSLVTVGCGESSRDHPYEIIDAGFGALSVSGKKELSWLDNETILFGGRPPEDFQLTVDEERTGTTLQSWNYKTGERQVIAENSAKIYCYDNGTLYLNAGFGRVFKTTITQDQGRFQLGVLEPMENQYFKKNQFAHCKVFEKGTNDIDWLTDLLAFKGQLRKSWREELSRKKKNFRQDYITTLFTEQFPEGKPLPELKLPEGFSHVAFNHQYLIRLAVTTERIEGYGMLRYKDYWLLSEDGSLEQLSLPGLWNTSIKVLYTRAGTVASARDKRTDNPAQADRGVFLISLDSGEVTELIHGISNSESVSPDGCKLAIAHAAKILPLGKSSGTIKIIDLCPQ